MTNSSEPKKKPKAKMRLIDSADKNPKIALKPGMKFEVQSVPIIDADLKKPKKVAARLCGGTSTCLALVEIE